MAKSAYTKFVLRTAKKSGVASLYTRRVGFNSNLMLNSRIEVDIKTWNNAISTPSRWNTFRTGDGKNLCDKLDEMSALIDNIIADPNGSKAKLEKAITALAYREQIKEQEAQKQALEEVRQRKKALKEAEAKHKREQEDLLLKQREESFTINLDLFISNAHTRTFKGKPISEKSIQYYKHLRRYINEYMEKKHIFNIQFDELNRRFYDDYISFLYTKGLQKNTIGNHIKMIKAIIRTQSIRIQSLAEEFLRCEKPQEKSDNIALTEKEIDMITNQHLPTEHLQTVRNLFVLMCWTGVRYSDLVQLTSVNIKSVDGGIRFFMFDTKKTEEPAVIKILPEAQHILDLYDDGKAMPRVITNQKFNNAIKEIMRITYEANPNSSLAEYETVSFTAAMDNGRAGKKKEIYQRWQMVSCHTARRTFATNMKLRGNDSDVIRAATGHTTTKSLERYIKQTVVQRAIRLQ